MLAGFNGKHDIDCAAAPVAPHPAMNVLILRDQRPIMAANAVYLYGVLDDLLACSVDGRRGRVKVDVEVDQAIRLKLPTVLLAQRRRRARL